MTRMCLNRRIGNLEDLRKELSAWEVERNSCNAKVDWHFTARDARNKLVSLYPKYLENVKEKNDIPFLKR